LSGAERRATVASLDAELFSTEFKQHERFLWGLCYRMTGSAADADDIVQDAFVRAIERPPERLSELRPWLVRVTMNLARDRLRTRKRTPYVGPWLPAPIETDRETEPGSVEVEGALSTEGRYDLLESVSFAFLVALEALTPKQRAVLILRDVFDYSALEAAAALGLSESNVKTTHHRARRALSVYDRERCRPDGELVARTRRALEGFLMAIARGDTAAVEALLAPDAVASSDGGGEFVAARVVLRGPARIAKAYLGIAKHGGAVARFELRTLNGLPALYLEQVPRPGTQAHNVASRVVVRCDVDARGLITRVYSVVATAKLKAVRPFAPAGATS
jgi:RNA polymerase sigma-70 factor, ECF subfamily